MKIDVRPRKRNAPRPAEKSAPQFLQWLRGRDCILSFTNVCRGKMEAAHLDFAGDKGMGTKVSDRFAVPMCSLHHASQHYMGWDTFLENARLTRGRMMMAAGGYWTAWPGRAAWERKLEERGR